MWTCVRRACSAARLRARLRRPGIGLALRVAAAAAGQGSPALVDNADGGDGVGWAWCRTMLSFAGRAPGRAWTCMLPAWRGWARRRQQAQDGGGPVRVLRDVKPPWRASCRRAARARHALRRPSSACLCAGRCCGKASKRACAVPGRCLPELHLPLASCLGGQRLRECCWAAWRPGLAAAGPGVLQASACASMLCGCSEGAPGCRRLFGGRLGIFVSRLPLQFFRYRSMPGKSVLSTSQCQAKNDIQ
jgi:hypothetical protein